MNLQNISPDTISDYKNEVQKNQSEATVKRKMASLTTFFDWAQREGRIDQNPLDKGTQVVSSEAVKSKGSRISLGNVVKITGLIVLVILILLLGLKLRFPIPFIKTPAEVAELPPGGTTPPSAATPTPQVVVTKFEETDPIFSRIYKDGVLTLEGLAPALRAIGGLLIGADTISIATDDNSDGDITLNPDGSGNLNLIFEGSSGNQVNATAGNLNSGNLYYGTVGNSSTGYNLINLLSGSTLISRFRVDALGNTVISGNLNLSGGSLQIGGVNRLTSLGRLASITGYYQDSGIFEIDQGAPDYADISKILTSGTGAATANSLNITLDESALSTGSAYDTLVLKRLGEASGGAALYIDDGDAIFDEQIQVGRYSSNPTAIGAGSIVFNTTDSSLNVWNGSSWTALGGGSSSGFWSRSGSTLSPTTSGDVVSISASGASPLTLTQTGAFNSLLVQDEAGDTTPFVVDTSGNVGIGNSAPGYKLEVTGRLFVDGPGTNNIFINGGAESVGGSNSNVVIGDSAFTSIAAPAVANVAIGYRAGQSATDVISNVYIGYDAGKSNVNGNSNTFIGQSAGSDTTGSYNTILGDTAGRFVTSSENVIIGYGAASSLTSGASVVLIGSGVDASPTVTNSVMIGTIALALASNTLGVGTSADARATDSIALGYSAGTGTSATSSIAIGSGALTGTTASASIALGQNSRTTAANQLVIGASGYTISDTYIGNAVTNTSPTGFTLNATGGSGIDIAGASLTIAGGKATGNATGGSLVFSTSDAGATGTTLQSLTQKAILQASGEFGIGITDPLAKLHVPARVVFGGVCTNCLFINGGNETATGERNMAFGNSALSTVSTGTDNVAIGFEAGMSNTNRSWSTFLGSYAGRLSNGWNNTFLGYGSGDANTTGDYNVGIGADSFNLGSGFVNSVAIGYDAGEDLTSGSDSNIVIGYLSGNELTTGDYNIFIGSNTATTDGNVSRSIVMGNGASSTASGQVVIGGSGYPITDVYIGEGVTNGSPSAFTLNATGASGTNIAGASMTLAGGKATGNAAGGSILFSTSDAGASGSGLQSLTTKLTLTAAGDLGLGTTPGAKFDIDGGSSSTLTKLTDESINFTGLTGASARYGDYLDVTFTGNSDTSTALYYGSYLDVSSAITLSTFNTQTYGVSATVENSATNGGNLIGGQFAATRSQSANTGTSYGILGTGTASHTSGTNALNIGAYGQALVSGAGGTTTDSVGLYGQSGVSAAATVSSLTGAIGYAYSTAASTITDMASLRTVHTITSGTITSVYGLYVPAITKTGGTVTTAYGIRINEPTAGSTNYALYSAGGTNYFGGSTGIGITGPNFKTSIVDSQAASNTAAVTNTNTTDGATTSVLRLNLGTASTGTTSRFVQFYAGSTTDNNGTGVGRIQLNNGNVAYNTGGADYAEFFEVSEPIGYGEIVSVKENGRFRALSGDALLGVVSESSGFIGNAKSEIPKENEVPVGLLGQIMVKVSSENGEIRPGDPITASSIPGVGAKAITEGYILGHALESLADTDPSNTKRVLTFVNPGWFNPNLELASSGNLKLGDPALAHTESQPNGTIYSIFETIKSGAFEIKNVTTESFTALSGIIDNLTVGNLAVNETLISPVVETSRIKPGNSENTIDIALDKAESGKVSVKDLSGDEVASIDNFGNADFKGTLSASKIYAEEIVGAVTLDKIEEILKTAANDQKLIAQSTEWSTNPTPAQNQTIGTLTVSDLFATGQVALGKLSVSDSLVLGNDTVITSNISDLTNKPVNSISTLTSPLLIQPLALASVELMAGKVRIDTNGNVEINGDLAVSGKLTSNSVLTRDLIVANSVQKNDTQISIDQEIQTNAILGANTIKAGAVGLTIKNSKVTSTTYIYITPTSPTKNNVLFLKSKGDGVFEVGFESPLDIDVSFNWWLVQTESVF